MAKNNTQSDTIKKEQEELSMKKKAMLQALEKSLRVVTTAARSLGIHRSTHYAWYNEDKDYREAVDDLEEVALDFAESQLHQQIKDGNTSATIFYLKTKGKKRGYIERFEHESLNPAEPIEVLIIDPTAQKYADQSE